jgi:general secretion pathway protein B
MSYILDALKKSEQERKQGEIPGLSSLQAHSLPPRYSSRMLIYLLSGILLLIALTIGLWLFFRQPPTPTPAEPTSEITTETALPQAARPQEIASETLPIAQETPQDKLNQPTIIAKPDTPTIKEPTPEPKSSPGTVEQPPATAADIENNEPFLPDDQDSPPPAQPELLSFANLPPDIRSALPKLVIAAHYYSSKPSARMASINGRIMRQGQSVSDGLVLEEIIREGVILSFHDYRFSLEVFNH